jgi:phenylacetate-CoA ligase
MNPLPDLQIDIDTRRMTLGFPIDRLRQLQNQSWQHLANSILVENRFYRNKFAGHRLQELSLESVGTLPMTTKEELVGDDRSAWAANLTYPAHHYTRLHRTSGTSGRPMMVLDTAQDWQHWIDGWQFVFDAADVSHDDRAVMAFSFGPFIGFWSAFDAAVARGLMVAPTGSLSTTSRLELIQSIDATVLFCTPSYALHMAEIAQQSNVALRQTAVTKIIVAGEPGGSVPAIRQRIETAWGATVIDHAGASEIGPWGFPDQNHQGLFVNETMFFAEAISLVDQSVMPRESLPSLVDADQGPLAELVLTTLARDGCPVIRYRTGDLIRPCNSPDSGFLFLRGGVLGRTDDMMIIRGVNVFPSSIEQIIRESPDIAEYRLTAFQSQHMDQLKIEIESSAETAEQLKHRLNLRLGLRVDVQPVANDSLPRFEAKGRRFIDQRRKL